MISRQLRESLSNRNNVVVLCGICNDSSKTVPHTLQPEKIKTRDTPKQGITEVRSGTNQSISSHNSSISFQIPSESFENPDLNKSSLTGALNLPQKQLYYTSRIFLALERMAKGDW